jgi:phospholipase/carboxylesterase
MLSGPEQRQLEGEVPKQLVVFLHGLGADGSDLISLAPHFAQILPEAYFVSPDAPFPCDMAPYGKQWFSLQDRSDDAILSGVKTAVPILEEYIATQCERFGLTNKDVVLIGFSQGTMLSLYTALRAKESYAGVLGYSGALVAPQLIKDEIQSSPEICLVHGQADEIVPFAAFEEAMSVLQAQGLTVHGFSREGLGHGIDPAGMQIGQSFLKGVFYGDNTPSKQAL